MPCSRAVGQIFFHPVGLGEFKLATFRLLIPNALTDRLPASPLLFVDQSILNMFDIFEHPESKGEGIQVHNLPTGYIHVERAEDWSGFGFRLDWKRFC